MLFFIVKVERCIFLLHLPLNFSHFLLHNKPALIITSADLFLREQKMKQYP
jgi:hypothetical protein